jgi:hypothetical protein
MRIIKKYLIEIQDFTVGAIFSNTARKEVKMGELRLKI